MPHLVTSDIDTTTEEQLKTQLKILKYWHHIEFFSPFNLDEITSRPLARYRIYQKDLQTHGNKILPWINAEARQLAGGHSNTTYHFDLYLLPFDKSEMIRLSQYLHPPHRQSEKYRVEFEERLDSEGKTCFAKLSLDHLGIPQLNRLAVSTLPWALGKLQAQDLGAITQKNYEKDLAQLQEGLELLMTHLMQMPSELISDQQPHPSLTAQILDSLIHTLYQWANYTPQTETLAVIELIPVKKNKKNKKTKNTLNLKSQDVVEVTSKNSTINEPVKKFKKTLNIEILNSFYASDLEKICNQIANQEQHNALKDYLLGIPNNKKIDLSSKEGKQAIYSQLSQQDQAGRWFNAPQQLLTTMQQFALNRCLDPQCSEGIFSVNGPPGTGKTTLFQEIIADNVVKRARVLSQFSYATDALIRAIVSVN